MILIPEFNIPSVYKSIISPSMRERQETGERVRKEEKFITDNPPKSPFAKGDNESVQSI